MTDKEIVEKAKEAEKRTGFGELVYSPISKGVNSAFGIGFIEGMVEYRNSLPEEPVSKFDSCIQEGDDVRYNEDLGCRVNLSQLKRVAKKEEPVSEDLKEAAVEYSNFERSDGGGGIDITRLEAFIAGAQWQKEVFEKNRLAACDRLTKEEAERETDFVDKVLLGEHRQPTYSDAIEYGIRWQQEHIWHDASKEQPEGNKDRGVVMILNNNQPYAGIFIGTRFQTDNKDHWEVYDGFVCNNIDVPVKWAYIDDILPNKEG